MRVLIVEDEKLSRERLIDIINQYDPGIEVVGALDSISSTVDFIKKQPSPDLIFMDIQLSDGLSFEIFKQVSTDKPIVFTTAYDQYALKAFEVNSLDYLVKPLSLDKVSHALEKFKKLRGITNMTFDAKLMESFLSKSKNYNGRFLVKIGRKLFYKNTSEISFFYADGKLVYLVGLESRGKYIIDHTLDDLAEGLLDPALFFRINRTYLVQIKAIEEIQPYTNQRLMLKLKGITGHDFIVSREKTPLFKSWLNY